MLKLTFKQTQAEILVRAASTILFNALLRAEYPLVSLSHFSEEPQYGFTASAESENTGLKFVRITDLQDGSIDWNTVPYCRCDRPEQYLLEINDILFARTGATTGKTHLVKQVENAVFASYLIRLRPKSNVLPEYLYSFFQSDAYWLQVSEEKEGSAQPNVNGKKLINIQIPLVDEKIQSEISKFLAVVRERQDGSKKQLPYLPPPLEDQRQVVLRIEELAAKVEEARGLRSEATKEAEILFNSATKVAFEIFSDSQITIEELVGRANLKNGKSIKANERLSEVLCVRLSAVRNGRIDCSDAKPVPMSMEDAKEYLIKPGDVFIVRGNGSSELVGQAGLVEECPENTIFPDLFIRIPLDSDQILPSFFVAWWNNPLMRDRIKNAAKTTSGIWKINQGHIASFSIPMPSLKEQDRIVTYLDNLKSKVDFLKRVQSEIEVEINALLPSILDKAFNGEL